MMVGDYALNEVQPVDMFPHTFHIEAVAKLTRRKKIAKGGKGLTKHNFKNRLHC
jgi:hypothetical protein